MATQENTRAVTFAKSKQFSFDSPSGKEKKEKVHTRKMLTRLQKIIKKEENHSVCATVWKRLNISAANPAIIKPDPTLKNCIGCSTAEALRWSMSLRDKSVTQGRRQVGPHGPLTTSSEHRLPPQFTRGRAHSERGLWRTF